MRQRADQRAPMQGIMSIAGSAGLGEFSVEYEPDFLNRILLTPNGGAFVVTP